MAEQERISRLGFMIRIGGVVAMIVAAAIAGLWLGEKSVDVGDDNGSATHEGAEEPAENPEAHAPNPPPVYFRVCLPSGAGRDIVIEEIRMAAEAGIQQYVLTVPLPWEGDASTAIESIKKLLEIAPSALIMLDLKFDPPPAWLGDHPNDTLQIPGHDSRYACPASDVWIEDAQGALKTLLDAVAALPNPHCIRGYVIGALEDGNWRLPDGYDTSEANRAGFQTWIEARYPDDAALQEAWGQTDAARDKVVVPEKMPTADPAPIFFELPAGQPYVDFLQYVSESTAGAINELAAFLKQTAGRPVTVLAPYGYAFEANGTCGHFALAHLLDGPLDGFISPISYHDRGLGGAGGMMGPVDSAQLHAKKWCLLDDTRTGLTHDPATGKVKRPATLRAEDVYGVQQRNFAAALTHRLGLFWSDSAGDGQLHDETMWKFFGQMAQIYSATEKRQELTYPSRPLMAVVVDENSRAYQQSGQRLNDMLLIQGRDAALRAGIPARFYLLSDVIAGRTPPAEVYLFLNTFHLTPEEREGLHALLNQNKATAIWMYAPGYFAENSDVENVAATVQMKVKRFDAPESTGSLCVIAGKWIGKDEAFGEVEKLDPLFYIEDPETDVIANYRTSGMPSVAVKFFENGSTSIFCADPSITAPLLREFLGLLELQAYFPETTPNFYDTYHFGPGLIALHAKETGNRSVSLDHTCDIQDLLLPEIGWLRKRTFHMPLKTGETRILQITPLPPESGESPTAFE